MHTISATFGHQAFSVLRELVATAKTSSPLAPVTILVRDNIAAITTRRALARGIGDRPGVAAITVLALDRLAEQLLASAGLTRPPVTSALLTELWRRELAADAGVFAPVVDRPATIRALVRAHSELRTVDAGALSVVEQSSDLGRDLVRLHRAVTSALLSARRDSVAVLDDAGALLRRDQARVAPWGRVILHLPDEIDGARRAFLAALDDALPELPIVLGRTHVPPVDDAVVTTLGLGLPGVEQTPAPATPAVAHEIVHASDSDDEVRAIVREVRLRLADGVPAHRIAVLHPRAVPYARLLHDHLATAGIRTNGPGVRPLRDRAVADAALALLELDPDALSRLAVFDWFGRAPIRLADSAATPPGTRPRHVPRTPWERLAREAGVTVADWEIRLAEHRGHQQVRADERAADPDTTPEQREWDAQALATVDELAAFIAELQEHLRAGREATTWAQLGEWASAVVARYLGRTTSGGRLPEDEHRALAAIEQTLGSLAELDDGAAHHPRRPDLRALVEILDVELDSRRPRVGRFGEGVFVGPVSAAPSLEVSEVIVVGLAEDIFPGRHGVDPLLPDLVRAATAGALPTGRDQQRRQQRALLAAFAGADHVTASFPRGDMRRGAERLPSRWLLPSLRALTGQPELEATRWAEASSPSLRSVPSHWAGVSRGEQPGTDQEWRLRHLSAGGHLDDDAELAAAVTLVRERALADFTRFDGNLVGVTGLPDFAAGDREIAPTTLEAYADCPHGYFVRRILGVSPNESPEAIVTLGHAHRGSIVHEVMDRLTSTAEAAGGLPGHGEPWSAEHRATMRTIAADVMGEYERRGLTGHPRLWERERALLLDDLELLLDADDARHAEDDSRIVASELAFGGRTGTPVHVEVDGGLVALRGSADRVDERRDGRLVVTDFKTGSASTFKDIKVDPVVAGTKLQLPAYAHAARRVHGRDEVEAGYWFVGRKDRGDRIDLALDGALEDRYRTALGTLVRGIREGRFIPRPPLEDDFSWVKCVYCNPDGVGYGHVRAASLRKRTDVVLRDLFGLLDPSVHAAELDGPTDRDSREATP